MDARSVLVGLGALTETIRGRIVLALEDGRELTVTELREVLSLPQSTVSRHLRVLADTGWVRSRRESTNRLYSTAEDGWGDATARLWAVLGPEFRALSESRDDAVRLERVLVGRSSRSKTFFSEAADSWDRTREAMFGDRFQLLALLALFRQDWTIGDLGCGTGAVAELLASLTQRVVAIDDSPHMLEAARSRLAKHSNVEVRRGALESLPLADGELDAATMILVLHHTGDPGRSIQESARAIGPGGRLLIVDMSPHERTDFQARMGHVWLGFSRPRVERWLRAAGMDLMTFIDLPLESSASGPPLFAATAVRQAGTAEPGPRPD